MMKDLQSCDSLKQRYIDLGVKIDKYAEVNLILVKENDSLSKLENFNRNTIQNLNQKLDQVNQKKGLSLFEGILIGIATLGIGLAI